MANTPEKTIRVGRGVKASIWLNSGQNGTWRNVTIARTFKRNGKLEDSTSFGLQELPFVEKAAALAYAYIREVEENEQQIDEAA